MEPHLRLIVAIALLMLALDGIAWMFGMRFPVTRWMGRTIRRGIGGAIVAIGRALAGKKKK